MPNLDQDQQLLLQPNVIPKAVTLRLSNIPFEKRGKREDEFLEAIKKVWTDDIVEFDGEFYKIPSSKIGPKPIQKPYPKILLGGFNPKTFQRIVKYADGWLGALVGPLETLDQMITGLKDSSKYQQES